jgi:hypothetical protein
MQKKLNAKLKGFVSEIKQYDFYTFYNQTNLS